MDIMEITRQLGRAIQEDPRYLLMQLAKQQSEEDEALQTAIGEFNLKRMAINNEIQKEERSEETLQRLNEEMRTAYGEIMENEHMQLYTEAKNSFDALIRQVNGMISLMAEGEDPDTCEYEEANCSGNCAACAGCE